MVLQVTVEDVIIDGKIVVDICVKDKERMKFYTVDKASCFTIGSGVGECIDYFIKGREKE